MFRIKLTDFRCFADAPPVEIKPITFLVGENSAGKTTFLAATRLLLESFIRSPLNPFNREPYHLGGFDQLAHYRGGVRGRAKRICIELLVPASPDAPAGSRRRQLAATKHKFTFVKGSPQPELAEYEFRADNKSVVLNLIDKVTIKLLQNNAELYQFKPKRLPPAALIRRDLSYLRFVFDEISFGLEPEIKANQAELVSITTEVLARFRDSSKFAMRRVFASAPVRTQPLRTYTPSEIVASAEGAHVPLEMARQKISSPDEWSTVHEKLNQFGRNSGLFDDIDIRLLGKRDGDPFQIMVRTGGPPMNIVDVGYGVSQALPIIYQLEQIRQHDTFLLQQPEVHLHPKAQAELGTLIARLSRARASSIYVLETHSDYIIDRVRMEVTAGRLDYRNVTIVYFDKMEHEVRAQNIYLAENGELLDPPDNFRSFFLEEQQRLLGL
ncbi:AAA family ATPase [Bradyrhizobium yuanmingense]|uniref:AAA family ATPase n=1 Tax=Bradyrhizobium yuanmingense TaxID=108015 RepID=UPI003515216C